MPPGHFSKGGIPTKRKLPILCAAILIFLLALGITLYPLISNWYNERHQSEIHTQYEEILDKIDDTELLEARAAAADYNATLVPGTQSSDSFSQEAIREAAENYDSLLNMAGDGIMGYVEIPLIRVDLPIYHGTETETLDVGIGHLLGTSLPVGGESTHSVLTAHSGMATQKLFSDLDQLEYGDVFYLQVLGETLAYQVDAYHWLADILCVPYSQAHIGYLGEYYCQKVIEESKKMLSNCPAGRKTSRKNNKRGGKRHGADTEAATHR